LTDDPIHLAFEGQERLGRRLAEIVCSMVYKLPGHGKPIDLVSAEVLQPQNERPMIRLRFSGVTGRLRADGRASGFELRQQPGSEDRKSTRLNSSHVKISYAVFCLKTKRVTRGRAQRRR